jgi:hypothetical protein
MPIPGAQISAELDRVVREAGEKRMFVHFRH